MNIWLTFLVKFLVLQTVISENVRDNGNSTVNEFSEENEGSRTLSRRKRFVIFPDGSSVQLVFCNQVSVIIPIGDIFLMGYTAALAWNLPNDPKYFNLLKEYERPLRRNDEVKKTVNLLDENGRIIARVPYKRKLIVNPAFAKRSIDENQITFKEKLKEKIDKKKMHERQMNRDYLKSEHMDEDAIQFHRDNRVDLYGKVETLITALGRDGRQCVLYKLCEAAQRRRGQGTFLQEFLTVVFTLPKGKEFIEDHHKEYDAAHTASVDCLARYPGCLEEQEMQS